MCFALKLALSLSKIIGIWLKAKKAKSGNVTLIELNEQTTAFSFFNLLFIHPHLVEKETVLNHEMVHIKQKHSLDILFFEVLQMICWFNPIIYFIKKDIKLLHEYIADELSTNSGLQKHEYAMFLIENSFGIAPTPLTNQIFNQSILKRRINMLNKKRTAGRARLRLLIALPLVGAMLCASTMAFTKDYGYIDLLPEKSKSVAPIQETPAIKKDQIKFPPPRVTQSYYSPKKYDKSTKNHSSLENKLIIINGKEVDYKNDFYGIMGADKIVTLKSTDALKKYGVKAKYGAVEATGKNIKIINTPIDKIKFPPPIVRPDVAYFFAQRDYKASASHPPFTEKRYIVVNGKPITDTTFYNVMNASKIKYLKPSDAISKYGDRANYGAVEITGGKINYLKPGQIAPPPPQDQIKFPPPIVKPDRKNLKRPPAVEPPPPGYKPKSDQIKFPPPVVRPDNQTVFYPRNEYRHDGKNYTPTQIDKRYIVINGEAVKDNAKFYGVYNTESIVVLSVNQAMKIYGNAGKYGAVEIKGSAIKYAPALLQPPFYGNLKLNRSSGDFLKIPDSEADLKTLTVYNAKNAIVYNSTDYRDDWNGKTGNYKKNEGVKISSGVYTYFMKIDGKPLANKRGRITIQ
ncbi:M56 family metallopeptidase [Pedobacter sp. UC225_61]|uniref:M56 family metallopeptidase n=1 Tax=Pedobacter sp. UC225_61 TaxID=3374623 RepID=UPI0037BCA5E0